MRQICAHGRELLGDDELSDLKGLTSTDAIDLEDEVEDNRPTLSLAQAYQIFALMREAGEDSCSYCRTKVTVPIAADLVEAEAVDESSDAVEDEESNGEKRKRKACAKTPTRVPPLGYLTPCAHILCKGCLPTFQKGVSDNFTPGMRGTCPICQLYNKIAFVELRAEEMKQYESGNSKKHRKKTYQYKGPSTKVKALLRDLMQNREASTPEDPGPIKSVVFSCWTSHMDLIEIAFKEVGVSYVRLDGSMNRASRSRVIEQFREDPTIEVILVSLLAGGLG